MVAATSHQLDALLMMVSAALVMAIVPGVGFFYGGMSGFGDACRAQRTVLIGVAVVVTIVVLGGIGVVTGPPLVPHLLGRPDWGMSALTASDPYPLTRAGWLIALSVLSVSLLGVAVSSSIALRVWVVFAPLWSVLVVFPGAYGVFSLTDGWTAAGLSVVDFGGVVPVSLAAGSGAAGVILACGRGGHRATGPRRSLVAGGGWAGSA